MSADINNNVTNTVAHEGILNPHVTAAPPEQKKTEVKVQNVFDGLSESVRPIVTPLTTKTVEPLPTAQIVISVEAPNSKNATETNSEIGSQQSAPVAVVEEAVEAKKAMMEKGHPEHSSQAPSTLTNIVKGGATGILVPFFCNPMDKLQAQLIAGTFQGLSGFYKSMYRGLGLKILSNTVTYTCILGIAPSIRRGTDTLLPDYPSLSKFLSYMTAAAIDPVFTAPLSTINMRMQAFDKSLAAVCKELPSISQPRLLLKELYAGSGAASLRNIAYQAPWAMFYENIHSAIKQIAIKKNTPIDGDRAIAISITASGIAGTLALPFSYPFEVISKKMKAQTDFKSSVSRTFMSILKTEGLKGLYKGIAVACPRMIVSSVIAGSVLGGLDNFFERKSAPIEQKK